MIRTVLVEEKKRIIVKKPVKSTLESIVWADFNCWIIPGVKAGCQLFSGVPSKKRLTEKN